MISKRYNPFKYRKLSIVTPVYNSAPIVSRHIKHYKKMKLPDDIEIIFIDDGSDIPLKESVKMRGLKNCFIYPTGDKRPWTIACARNLGVKIAEGEYILMTDIDHIFNKEAIMAAYNFTDDKMFFKRFYGVLDNRGNLKTDLNYLLKYGLPRKNYRHKKTSLYYHVGTHVTKKAIIKAIRGYPEHTCEYGTHPTREDRLFYHRYRKYKEAGHAKKEVFAKLPAAVYMFPPRDPRGYFHNYARCTTKGYVNEGKLYKR